MSRSSAFRKEDIQITPERELPLVMFSHLFRCKNRGHPCEIVWYTGRSVGPSWKTGFQSHPPCSPASGPGAIRLVKIKKGTLLKCSWEARRGVLTQNHWMSITDPDRRTMDRKESSITGKDGGCISCKKSTPPATQPKRNRPEPP